MVLFATLCLIYYSICISWSKTITCNDEFDCDGLTFNATNATNVTFSCTATTGCFDVTINAPNADVLDVLCDSCVSLTLLADFTETINVECTYCKELTIEAESAGDINIIANSLQHSTINALKADSFALECQESEPSACNDITLKLPSDETSSISCIDNSCGRFTIYSYSGLSSIEQLLFFSCGACFNAPQCMNSNDSTWTVYCGNDLNKTIEFDGNACSDEDTCNCKQFLDGKAIEIIDGFDTKECGRVETNLSDVRLALGVIFAGVFFLVLFALFVMFIISVSLPYYRARSNIEPPSPWFLIYIHFFDGAMWASQIYVLIIVNGFYEIWDRECARFYGTNLNKNNAAKDMCTDSEYCDATPSGECNVNFTITGLWLFIIVVISVALFADLCRIIWILLIKRPSHAKDRQIRLLGDSIWFRLFYVYKHQRAIYCIRYRRIWHHIINNYYQKRRFFRIGLCTDTLLVTYIVIRFFCYFIGAVILYVVSNDMTNALRWYDIFPMLLLWIFNEALFKLRYKSLDPYDPKKHIPFVVRTSIGNKKIAELILEYYSSFAKDIEDSESVELEAPVQLVNQTGGSVYNVIRGIDLEDTPDGAYEVVQNTVVDEYDEELHAPDGAKRDMEDVPLTGRSG